MSTTPHSRPSDALTISLSLSQDRRFWEERGLSTLKHAGLCVCVCFFFFLYLHHAMQSSHFFVRCIYCSSSALANAWAKGVK